MDSEPDIDEVMDELMITVELELIILQVETGSNGTVMILRDSTDETLHVISILNVLDRSKLIGKAVTCPNFEIPTLNNLRLRDSCAPLLGIQFCDTTPTNVTMTATPAQNTNVSINSADCLKPKDPMRESYVLLDKSYRFTTQDDEQDYHDSDDEARPPSR